MSLLQQNQSAISDSNKFEPLGGYVTTVNLFNKKTGKPDPNGLLSEQIFGPITNKKCSCGAYSGSAFYGKVCPKCGVICGDNSLRITQFGRIKLLLPVYKTNKQKYLITKFLGNKYKQLFDTNLRDANQDSIRYIALRKDKGATVIVTSLTPISNYVIIPFRITGIYSFIFVLKYLAFILNVKWIKEIFDKDYITDEIKVIPPDIRPATQNTQFGGKMEINTDPVNTYYVALLNNNSRNQLRVITLADDERKWCEMITDSIVNHNSSIEVYDQIACDHDFHVSRYQYYVNNIYSWAYNLISGKSGLIRSSVLSRTIDFSSRSIITINPNLKPYEIEVSRPALYILWQAYFINYLIKYKHIPSSVVLNNIISKSFNQLKRCKEYYNLFIEFLDWFAYSEEAAKVMPSYDIDTSNR